MLRQFVAVNSWWWIAGYRSSGPAVQWLLEGVPQLAVGFPDTSTRALQRASRSRQMMHWSWMLANQSLLSSSLSPTRTVSNFFPHTSLFSGTLSWAGCALVSMPQVVDHWCLGACRVAAAKKGIPCVHKRQTGMTIDGSLTGQIKSFGVTQAVNQCASALKRGWRM